MRGNTHLEEELQKLQLRLLPRVPTAKGLLLPGMKERDRLEGLLHTPLEENTCMLISYLEWGGGTGTELL